MALLLLVVGGLGGAVFFYYMKTLPPVEEIIFPPMEHSSPIYAKDGSILASVYLENREPLSYEEIPDAVKLATIAAEDARFFLHRGVDVLSVFRALLANLKSGRFTQGGSTITQQLVRNVFLTRKKTLDRKIREMLFALLVEGKYSKEKILELYLNQIYYGNQAYGIEAAAKTYFRKDVKNLTLDEVALLVGLPRAPAIYDPYKNPDKAKRRRNYILDRMEKLNFISQQESEIARKRPLHLAPKRSALFGGTSAPYFVASLLEDMKERYGGEAVYRGGLKIFTTIDPQLQEWANESIQEGLKEADKQKRNATQAALVALDARTGYILAMVGGKNFQESQFNRVTQAKRQPGSAFKPFIYLTALLQGLPPDMILVDEPTTFWVDASTTYSPENYDGKFRGPLTLIDGLKYSVNVMAIKLNDIVGPENAVQVAHLAGIESPLEPVLSLPLGTSTVTPLELTTAFCTLANMGERIRPMSVLKVENDRGETLEIAQPVRKKAIDEKMVYLLVQMMKKVVEEGTGRGAKIDAPAAGKTGTTSDYRDAWFVGFTSRLCVGVWFGNDDNTPTHHLQGGGIPAYTWRLFMSRAITKYPSEDFIKPEGAPDLPRAPSTASPEPEPSHISG